GGGIGIPGLYVTEDPGASDKDAQKSSLKMDFGTGWSKAQSFATGQTPVMRYHHKLMNVILNDKANNTKADNATDIDIEDDTQGYLDFDKRAAKKYVLEQHGLLR